MPKMSPIAAKQSIRYQKPHTSSQSLRSLTDLEDQGLIETTNDPRLEEVARRFAIGLTPAMADVIDPKNPADPVARQFIPDARELDRHPTDVSDPIGDRSHSPVAGIVHRYPDRLLLTPIHVCPVYCRFCFRRETVGKPEQALLSDSDLETALDYIRNHPEVWEVILSGGDPLLLSPRRIQTIVTALNEIEHVGVIRIHTRVPVVDPDRISCRMIDALRSTKAVYVVLHSNHVKELTSAAREACALIVDSGIPMLSQTVLLKGVNDDPDTLERLLRTLVANRIKPYYLHHADRAPGTAHFRTSIEAGREIVRSLRGRVSGLCQPAYVLDIPGGAGKVPLDDGRIAPGGLAGYRITDYQGNGHDYADPFSNTDQSDR